MNHDWIQAKISTITIDDIQFITARQTMTSCPKCGYPHSMKLAFFSGTVCPECGYADEKLYAAQLTKSFLIKELKNQNPTSVVSITAEALLNILESSK